MSEGEGVGMVTRWRVVVRYIKRSIQKIKCRLGFHSFELTPILADLDTYWMQGGKRCEYCDAHVIDFVDARRKVEAAYQRGKDKTKTHFMAYGRGVDDIVALYGKPYVQAILDKVPDK